MNFLSIKDQFTNGFREFLNHASLLGFSDLGVSIFSSMGRIIT